MKKISILLVGILLLTSCNAKRTSTRVHTNTRKRPVSEPQKRPYKSPEKLKIKHQTYNSEIVNKLYENSNLNPVTINYIKAYNELAILEMQTYKIPASITLAQGLLESRFGQSTLTKKSKNHFGIKCHSNWNGEKVYHDDDAKGECFRKYRYDANSYRDHSLFLTKKRYAKLFTYASNDYKSWAKGLRIAGYATDSRYPQKLIALIEKYKLYTFDNLVLGDDYKPTAQEKHSTTHQEKYHIVKSGESLYSISGIYLISVSDLKRFNHLKSNTISVGQKIRLIGGEDPIKQTSLKTHIVKQGETLYTLSKRYNLTIEKLKTLNNLSTNGLFIGQKLFIE